MCSYPENGRFGVFVESLFNDVSIVNDDEMRHQKNDVDRHDASLLTKETARLVPEVIDHFSKLVEASLDLAQLTGHSLTLGLFFHRKRNLKK